jgi:hypothetical protein
MIKDADLEAKIGLATLVASLAERLFHDPFGWEIIDRQGNAHAAEVSHEGGRLNLRVNAVLEPGLVTIVHHGETRLVREIDAECSGVGIDFAIHV